MNCPLRDEPASSDVDVLAETTGADYQREIVEQSVGSEEQAYPVVYPEVVSDVYDDSGVEYVDDSDTECTGYTS